VEEKAAVAVVGSKVAEVLFDRNDKK